MYQKGFKGHKMSDKKVSWACDYKRINMDNPRGCKENCKFFEERKTLLVKN